VCPTAASCAISPSARVSSATNGPASGAESAPMAAPTAVASRTEIATARGRGHPATLVSSAQAYAAVPKGGRDRA